MGGVEVCGGAGGGTRGEETEGRRKRSTQRGTERRKGGGGRERDNEIERERDRDRDRDRE